MSAFSYLVNSLDRISRYYTEQIQIIEKTEKKVCLEEESFRSPSKRHTIPKIIANTQSSVTFFSSDLLLDQNFFELGFSEMTPQDHTLEIEFARRDASFQIPEMFWFSLDPHGKDPLPWHIPLGILHTINNEDQDQLHSIWKIYVQTSIAPNFLVRPFPGTSDSFSSSCTFEMEDYFINTLKSSVIILNAGGSQSGLKKWNTLSKFETSAFWINFCRQNWTQYYSLLDNILVRRGKPLYWPIRIYLRKKSSLSQPSLASYYQNWDCIQCKIHAELNITIRHAVSEILQDLLQDLNMLTSFNVNGQPLLDENESLDFVYKRHHSPDLYLYMILR